MAKYTCLLLLLFFSAFPGDLVAQNIPKGKAILMDGKITDKEWSDARRVDAADSVKIYFKQHAEYVLIAVKVPDGKNMMVDMYCSTASGLVNLHASAKLGQRQYSNNNWGDWIWWNNEFWAANVGRVASFEERTFLKEHVREFQIRKSFFASAGTKILFDITYIGAGNTLSTIHFPASATNTQPQNWLAIHW
nr:hypothetical protein [uncultured Mucilaginibacter sp.]